MDEAAIYGLVTGLTLLTVYVAGAFCALIIFKADARKALREMMQEAEFTVVAYEDLPNGTTNTVKFTLKKGGVTKQTETA
jgi:hypothetical protein